MTTMQTRHELAAAIREIPMPANLAGRPISEKGFPVPYFVAWLDAAGKTAPEGTGRPDFRVVDRSKLRLCVDYDRCWLCGRVLGKWRAMLIGPMCLLTGTSSEPDSHVDCAEYAAKACPFLTQPRMARNTKGLPPDRVWSATGIKRNPGVTAIVVHWRRRLLRIRGFGDERLFRVPDEIQRISFWAEGRLATRREVIDSIVSGLPEVMGLAKAQGADAVAAFQAAFERCVGLVVRWTDDFEPRAVDESNSPAALSSVARGRGAVA